MPFFKKKEKKSPNFGKGALFVSIYALNSHSKCSFKSILEENRVFPCGVLLLYVIHEKFILVPSSKKPSLSQKIPGCAPEV